MYPPDGVIKLRNMQTMRTNSAAAPSATKVPAQTAAQRYLALDAYRGFARP